MQALGPTEMLKKEVPHYGVGITISPCTNSSGQVTCSLHCAVITLPTTFVGSVHRPGGSRVSGHSTHHTYQSPICRARFGNCLSDSIYKHRVGSSYTVACVALLDNFCSAALRLMIPSLHSIGFCKALINSPIK